ncbi:NAD(P)-binding protein [Wolfiporia cocos MD-104 SS10]|uniref:NAD(P)-binding protein n=1 Tax=Wolfiporia cocos (strain MD-104) TaxID=742152 RepID=A0A2H3K0G7_WOLCO|nr:NAD(P)-binding protein [Wolfiporia cocos MD-104 SS10]
MPAVTSGKVLVTGANGFVAAWVVDALLRGGYSVRATVRSESKSTHLRKVFASFGDKLEFAIVNDITKEGAFDNAVQGVDAIEHIASPCHLGGEDPQEYIAPAVNGTVRLLESARTFGSSVKRIVFTSSCGTVAEHGHTTPRVFSEADWNRSSLVEVQEKGHDASPLAKYRASKVMGERAAWDFFEKNKGGLSWDLVVLNPPLVYGPILHEVNSPDGLNASMDMWYRIVFKDMYDQKKLSTEGNECVDVRDLATAHVLAIQKQDAAGNRIIVSQGSIKWQDYVDAARKCGVKTSARDESYDPSNIKPVLVTYDSSKAIRLLGMKYRSTKQSVFDIIEDFKARGWI